MSRIKLDLSQFKHLKSDDKSTMLQHKDGHILTLAHNALSKESQAQLNALSKLPKQDETQDQTQESRAKMADGGQPQLRQVSPERENAITDAASGTQPQPQQKPARNPKPQRSQAEDYAAQDAQKEAKGGKICMAAGGQAEDPGQAPQTSWDDMSSDEKNADVTNHFSQYKGEAGQQKAQELIDQIGPGAMGSIGKVAGEAAPMAQQVAPELLDYAKSIIANPKQALQISGGVDPGKLQQLRDLLGHIGPVIMKGMARGGKVRMAEGGKMLPDPGFDDEKSNRDINSEVEDSENFINNLTKVPTEVIPGPSEDQRIYQQAHDQSLKSVPDFKNPIAGALQMYQKGMNPEDQEINAAEAGIHAVKWNKENQEEQAATQQAQQARKDKLNTELSAIGAPPLPGAQANGASQVTANPENPVDVSAQPQSDQTQQPTDQTANSPMDLEGGYNKQMQGLSQEASAIGQRAGMEQEALKQDLASKQQAQSNFQDSWKNLEAERQAHMMDIQNGHINPDAYWKGMYNPATKQFEGGHSKIAAAIGLIASLGGSAGFLQHQIDRNIDAQKANLNSQHNLLTANLAQFKNLHDAADMTRVMQADVLGNQLQMAAAKTADPMAKAKLLQAQGELTKTYFPLFQQLAMRRAMMNLADNGGSTGAMEHTLSYMDMIAPEQAKMFRERLIPGVGMASVSVPQGVRDQLVSHAQLDNTARDVLNYSQNHTNLVPGTAAYNTGVQKATILQQKIREGLLGTVFRESEKPLLKEFVDANPAGAFKMVSTQPKLKTIIERNSADMNVLKNSLGIKSAPQTVSNPNSQPQYKTYKGVKYMRGPSGQPIPVK